MFIWSIDKAGNETKEMLEEFAKKIKYRIVDEREDANFYQFKLEKTKAGQPKKNELKNITREKIIEFRNQGKTMDEIAKIFGVSRSSVYNYLGQGYIRKKL